jgi:hypothetical protein
VRHLPPPDDPLAGVQQHAGVVPSDAPPHGTDGVRRRLLAVREPDRPCLWMATVTRLREQTARIVHLSPTLEVIVRPNGSLTFIRNGRDGYPLSDREARLLKAALEDGE